MVYDVYKTVKLPIIDMGIDRIKETYLAEFENTAIVMKDLLDKLE